MATPSSSRTSLSLKKIPFIPRYFLSDFGKEVWLLLDDQNIWWRSSLFHAWIETRDLKVLPEIERNFADLLPPDIGIINLRYGFESTSFCCAPDILDYTDRTVEYYGTFTRADQFFLHGKLIRRLRKEETKEMKALRKLRGQTG